MSLNEEPSDEKIVRLVLDGDTDAFGQLVVRYRGHVMKIVSGHVPELQIEEVSHEVFIRAYRSLRGFGFRSGFKQWISSIAHRTCYDYWRKAYRSKEMSMSSLTESQEQAIESVLADSSDPQDVILDKKEASGILSSALARLSAEDRMVITLVHLEGMTQKEAAVTLGWTTANVKIRSFRAKKKLKSFIEESLGKGGRP